LSAGQRADITILDHDLRVVRTYVAGVLAVPPV